MPGHDASHTVSPPTRSSLWLYGGLALPMAFAGLPLYLHAPDYYATHYGLSLASLGGLLLLLRLLDAVQDPLFGWLSDRYAHMRPWFVMGSAPILGLGVSALFLPPAGFATSGHVWWFAGSMLLATSAYSLLSINLNSLGSLWAGNRYQQTRIASLREGLTLLGLLLAVLLPPLLQQAGHLSVRASFVFFSLLLASLLVVTLVGFFRWQQHYGGGLATQPTPPSDARSAATSPLTQSHAAPVAHLYRLFLPYLLSMLASAIPVVLVLPFIRDRLQAEAYTGLFLLLYFLAGAFGVFGWKYLSQRIGLASAWFWANLLAVVSFIWASTLQAGDIWPYAWICLTSGLAFGADAALPPALLGDALQRQQRTHRTSLYYSLMAFINKAVLALAAAVTLPWLEAKGFQPGQTNSEMTLQHLSMVYAAVPCGIKAVAALSVWLFLLPSHQGASSHVSLSHKTL